MAVRSFLLSVAAVLTCLTVNEAPACPTQHDLVVPATQAFSHDIEDESISTYIGELAASARSSYDDSVSNTDGGRPTSVEILSTNGRALIDAEDESVSSHLPESLQSPLPNAFSTADELTRGSKQAKHLLDIEDESVSTHIRELAAAAASVEIAPEARTENSPTILQDLTSLLDQSQIRGADLDPATTGSVPLDPWAVHHRRDE
jgi:hypothetical protein